MTLKRHLSFVLSEVLNITAGKLKRPAKISLSIQNVMIFCLQTLLAL